MTLPIPTDTKVRKVHQLKVAEITENVIKGDASAIGNVDRGGDVIFPGFYADALEGFRKSGFVAVGHNWSALPVAMPTLAEEKGMSLYCEAKYHSTPAAQEARTVAMERKDAGLDVGLSVGFSMKGTGYKWFAKGADLLEYAKTNSYDLSLFDEAGIAAWTNPCRGLLKCDELYEYSIVTVPMNPMATASEAKSMTTSDRKFWTNYGYDYESGTWADTTAAAATVGALNQIYYQLCEKTADTLADQKLTPAEIASNLAPVFQRFSDNSIAIILALMTILSDAADDSAKAAAIEAVRKGAPSIALPAADTIVPVTEAGTDASSDDAKSAIARTIKNLAIRLNAAPVSKG